MSDIKTDFRKWLQNNFNKSTAYSYYAVVQKIFDKNFGSQTDWSQYFNEIMPLLARYFEFANREYYLDRVTIWYALDYFDEIAQFIYPKQGKTYKNEPDVKISIYDGQQYYPLYETTLFKVSECLKYISSFIYQYNIEYDINDDERLKILAPLPEIERKINPLELKDAAIHVDYNNKNIGAEKTALSRYCDFLYSATANSAFDYTSSLIVNVVTTKSPKNYISGFIEVEPITGEHARKIRPNPEAKRHGDVGYVYSTRDLANIFNIDFNTASNLMTKFGVENKITTAHDGYYNADITHKILKIYHHYEDKKQDEVYSGVDYTKAGYEHWKTRKDAMRLLGIKKLAFYSHVANKCLYIDYAQGAPRYYLPELKYFNNLPEIRHIKTRKNNIKNKMIIS
ncbi:hypothetical protein IJ556_02090 [bacterium]|nr:hypothetical protein [bacterium]